MIVDWLQQWSCSVAEVNHFPASARLRLIATARSHLTFMGPVHLSGDQILIEVGQDNLFYEQWYTQWTKYYGAPLTYRSQRAALIACRSQWRDERSLHQRAS